MKYNRTFQALAIPIVNVYDHLKYNYHVIGREKVPDGGCVLVANHTQWADPVLVGTALGAFPVDRGTADIGAIKTSLKAVKEGKKLLIFPEGGTKHKAGDEAKVGAAMIAARTGAPIVPIYISENKKFRSKVYVVFGDAYIPEKTKSKDGYRAIADDMMRHIYALKEKI